MMLKAFPYTDAFRTILRKLFRTKKTPFGKVTTIPIVKKFRKKYFYTKKMINGTSVIKSKPDVVEDISGKMKITVLCCKSYGKMC